MGLLRRHHALQASLHHQKVLNLALLAALQNPTPRSPLALLNLNMLLLLRQVLFGIILLAPAAPIFDGLLHGAPEDTQLLLL